MDRWSFSIKKMAHIVDPEGMYVTNYDAKAKITELKDELQMLQHMFSLAEDTIQEQASLKADAIEEMMKQLSWVIVCDHKYVIYEIEDYIATLRSEGLR